MGTKSICISFARDSFSGHDGSLSDSEIDRFEELCASALRVEFPGVEIEVGVGESLESSYHASGFDPDGSDSCRADEDAEESARTTVAEIWNSGKWADPS